jgi:hypothetical protein
MGAPNGHIGYNASPYITGDNCTRARAREVFLKCISEGHPVAYACKQSGIPYSTAYREKKEDEDFRKAWNDAYEQGSDFYESVARDWIVNGRIEFHDDGRTKTRRVYSEKMLLATLAARRPAQYYHPGEGTGGVTEIIVTGGLPDSKFLVKPQLQIETSSHNPWAADPPGSTPVETDEKPPDKPES